MNPRQLWLHDGTAAAIEEMLDDEIYYRNPAQEEG